jgi:MoaA/NifB/PqqE/SkfB family radical SAM enzyme/SAM-dependent methyltransferase
MRGDEFFKMMARTPPFSRLHPRVAQFFKEYLAHEKVVKFGDRFVLNTSFPPYPSPAFDRMAEQFSALGEAGAARRLFSVTWAVTNRCDYHCWHCYNAGRNERDLPLSVMKELAAGLQARGVVIVTFTGGEPLLRRDLEEIAASFDGRSCLIVGTTGDGLTPGRAKALAKSGVFAAGVSLDSDNEAEHDRLRGRKGAFRTALRALRIAAESGLYPYVVTVATREALERGRFISLLNLAAGAGAREVHLLEPSATGRLAGRADVLLSAAERQFILDYQREIASCDDLPIVSSFAYLESADAFGCGAGLTHLYIDGSGEVCPCNLVPFSFGNAAGEDLGQILDRMGKYFSKPRTTCVGRELTGHFPSPPGRVPSPPEDSEAICSRCLPREHEVPRFFKVREEARGDVGAEELRAAYDRIHGDYDGFWLAEAGRPVRQIIERLRLRGAERIFEAGCGTGYATALLAARLSAAGRIVAVDLSEGMLDAARRRLGDDPRVRLVAGDAIEALSGRGSYDLVFSSWVLGYIPLAPFFAAAAAALKRGGRLAFVVHRDNSPRVPLEIFAELVAEDPMALEKRVAFDFPRGAAHLRGELGAAGFDVSDLEEGSITFRYATPELVLEHLLKSGAGTAYYDAIVPAKRAALEKRFIERFADIQKGKSGYEVTHDYFSVIARKTGGRRGKTGEDGVGPRYLFVIEGDTII